VETIGLPTEVYNKVGLLTRCLIRSLRLPSDSIHPPTSINWLALHTMRPAHQSLPLYKNPCKHAYRLPSRLYPSPHLHLRHSLLPFLLRLKMSAYPLSQLLRFLKCPVHRTMSTKCCLVRAHLHQVLILLLLVLSHQLTYLPCQSTFHHRPLDLADQPANG
jgi:hypothetical protein